MSQHTKVKAVFFDFMGTCLDWHSAVVGALPPSIDKQTASQLALEWRRQYFLANADRVRHSLPPEDIDETLPRVLHGTVLEQCYPDLKPLFDGDTVRRLIAAWHSQPAWPEVREAMRALKEDLGYDMFVHANGTTRLQLDLTRYSGLNLFDMLFSSQLLGVYKPRPEAYLKALELVQLKPEEVVLVAAHAYDLRGAQAVGIRTIYVHRWTDDIDEDMDKVKGEFDEFLQDMKELPAAVQRLSAH